MQLTKNFNLSEFTCNDGTKVPNEFIVNAQELANQLQILRDFLGCAIKVNSGYRTRSYNISVGGATSSQHLLCKAADIVTDKYTPEQVYAAVELLISNKQLSIKGVGRYNSFTHIDTRKNKARWDLRTIKN